MYCQVCSYVKGLNETRFCAQNINLLDVPMNKLYFLHRYAYTLLPTVSFYLIFCSVGGMLASIQDMGDNIFVGELVDASVTHYWAGQLVFS